MKKWIYIIILAIPIYISEQQYEKIQKMEIEYNSLDKTCEFLQEQIKK